VVRCVSGGALVMSIMDATSCPRCDGELQDVYGCWLGLRTAYLGKCWVYKDWLHCRRTPRAAYEEVRGIGGRKALRMSRDCWGMASWRMACRKGLW